MSDMTKGTRKIVYFMRHGTTAANYDNRLQGPDEPLTEEGRVQAEKLAERVGNLPIEALLASPWPRARETAEIIAQRTAHVPVYWDDLIECRGPSELVGAAQDAPGMTHARAQIHRHGDDPNWRYSDEETYPERLARARRVLADLAAHENEHIGVVTHGNFLHHLVLSMWGEPVSAALAWRVFQVMHPSNTAITVARYDAKDEAVPWRLITWNDHAHLG